VRASPWDAAVAARQRFEAEPAGIRTRQEYAKVMDGFRTIYHADPGDAHAARAVVQVAELLAEQGREFGDKKSLHDAAGQYEFLAKAYPGGSMAPRALVQALDLLGPEDKAEARRVRAELAEDYPRYAGSVEAESVSHHTTPTDTERTLGARLSDDETVAKMGHPAVVARDVPGVGRSVVADKPNHRDETAMNEVPASAPVVRAEHAEGRVIPEVPEKEQAGPLSVVTGIRHWSTASYTRVAIDLNVDPSEDVKYEAARVENPDRIFFDLHHARLAPQLAGKSFTVTDDGFLTKIRAAQFSNDVTRVVLDVHEVTEYSAFLLPNPYRLIIDIHGKQEKQDVGNGKQETANSATPKAGTVEKGAPVARGAVEVSSLPPMAVTDGSAGFGLPVRSSAAAETERVVAQPRVVISSKPTAAKPVPNTVTRSSTDIGTELAAVSEQPGKVEATRRPTSHPISSKSSEQSSEYSTADSEQPGSGEHYVPRSRRAGIAASKAAGSMADTISVANAAPAEIAPPTADGETSLTRALGLKIGRIVIDAGHGGHDSGTLGVDGIEEKDVVLDVALRLGRLLHDRLGADVVYTRADDTFIPLETRTAIANKAQADLFISVHANSSPDESARGVEVYYLNFTSDPEAMTVASRENAVSTESVHELSDLVKKIALKDKIEESRELASDVDASLYAGLRKGNAGLKDRGVKKAPFVVLIGANMPSILAEISFVTNPTDAAKLEMPEYRERVAESLYKGIARYAEGINGVKPKVRTMEQAER
jgi:N-acetylmuramoyl-L-alanine amidase